MKLATTQITKLIITDVEDMDPISAMVEDFGPGAGKITITSGGEAWTHYWSHMGTQHTMRSFFLKCETPYLIGKLSNGIRKQITDEDPGALLPALRKKIIRGRKEGLFTADEARDLWRKTEWADISDKCACQDTRDLLCDIFGSDEWWEHVPKTVNPEYEWLGKIVDTVKAAFALEQLQKVEVAAKGGPTDAEILAGIQKDVPGITVKNTALMIAKAALKRWGAA